MSFPGKNSPGYALLALALAARAGDGVSLARLREAVANALKVHAGNRAKTAKELGISERALRDWLSPVGSSSTALGFNDLAAKYVRRVGNPDWKKKTKGA